MHHRHIVLSAAALLLGAPVSGAVAQGIPLVPHRPTVGVMAAFTAPCCQAKGGDAASCASANVGIESALAANKAIRPKLRIDAPLSSKSIVAQSCAMTTHSYVTTGM